MRYADLSSVWRACRGPLTKNGLAITQIPVRAGQGWELISTLWHTSGQWMRAIMPLKLERDNMQGLGSAITYARRYSMAALVGVTQEDDDGERSINRDKQQGKAQQNAPQGNRPPAQGGQKNAQNGQKNQAPPSKTAQNEQKIQDSAKAQPPGPATFADTPAPPLKRARGLIVKDILAAAKALGMDDEKDAMVLTKNLELEAGKLFEGKTSTQLNEDELEKLLSKLENDRVGK